uniref:Tachykinin receptor 2 n=1 Tax=Varanus komodoensis TaxID=61221 RepID=A0A8D2KSD2_VARKO
FVICYVTTEAVGNSTVIWIILTHKQMRIVPNYFIVNLALSNFLMTALNRVFNFIYASHNVWYFGEGFCQFLNFIPITAVFVSVYSMTAIAAERYVAIVYPFKKKLASGNSKVITGNIWLAAIGLAFPQFLYSEIRIDNGITKCIIIWPGDPDNTGGKRSSPLYHIALIVLVYLLPLTVMFVLYSIIGITLWNHVVPGDDTNKFFPLNKRHTKFVRTMVAIVIAFAISWFPYHLFFILGSIWKDISRKVHLLNILLTVFLLAMSSAVYSPIMYCYVNQRRVRCCKDLCSVGTWNVRSMNQDKLDVVKQEMTRLNIDILGISELKWTGMGEFNSNDHRVYYSGQKSLRRNGIAFIVNK